MKMKLLFTAFMFVAVILASGCRVKRESSLSSIDLPSQTAMETEMQTEESKAEIIDQPSANDFSLFMDDKYVTLKDWDKNNYVINILGKPIKESVEVLDEGADTFAGSSIKTLEYEGLIIKLFLGEEYWITKMEITGKRYKTYRGISVGMSVNDLKAKYDNITQSLDDRIDVNNCGYTINDQEKFIWFEVENGIIKEIKYYLELG